MVFAAAWRPDCKEGQQSGYETVMVGGGDRVIWEVAPG